MTGSTTSRCCKESLARCGAPFAHLPEPLQRLRHAVLRIPGGDRAMAQVLAIVPSAGLDSVLVAVELALESAPPSARVSVEHELNVAGPAERVPGAAADRDQPPIDRGTARRHRPLRPAASGRRERPCVT